MDCPTMRGSVVLDASRQVLSLPSHEELHQAVADRAEVLREVIREGAQSFVVAHNHPTGDPLPSSADARVTQNLRAAAEAVGLLLADHLIVGDPMIDPCKVGYYSFRTAGRL
jgi:DNA repair protein RadC